MATQQETHASEHHFLVKKDLKTPGLILPYPSSRINVPFISCLPLQVTGMPNSLLELYENNKNQRQIRNESLKNYYSDYIGVLLMRVPIKWIPQDNLISKHSNNHEKNLRDH